MKILITGATGMLGTDLVTRFTGNGKYEVVAQSRSELDITDFEKVKEVLENEKPDVVINSAAYTAVDKAESEEGLAFKVNSLGVENLAKCAKEIGAKLVHFSTDFVFDGEEVNDVPYKVDSPVNPIGVYGRSKLDGEEKLKSSIEDFIIIRTSWLYGVNGKNFVTAIMNKVSNSDELKVVSDQYGSPTFTVDLAEATEKLIEKDAKGVFHFSNDSGKRGMSWHEFAVGVWGQMVYRDMPYKIGRVEEISTAEYPTPAKRPKYSVLDLSKYKEFTGCEPPDWKEGLVRYFDKLPKTISDI